MDLERINAQSDIWKGSTKPRFVWPDKLGFLEVEMKGNTLTIRDIVSSQRANTVPSPI